MKQVKVKLLKDSTQRLGLAAVGSKYSMERMVNLFGGTALSPEKSDRFVRHANRLLRSDKLFIKRTFMFVHVINLVGHISVLERIYRVKEC